MVTFESRWSSTLARSALVGTRLLVGSVALLSACGDVRGVAVDRPSVAPAAVVAQASPSAPTPAPVVPREADAPRACPDGMARIGPFCIDRYEAHLVTRGPSGELTPHPPVERPEEGVSYEARSDAGVFPQAYVSRVESESACRNAGKRLCTKTEWQRACRGDRGTTYPYAERWQPNRCNTDKSHLITLRFGADSRRWRYEQFNDPTLDQEPGFLAKTGEYDGCVGDAGVYDLVGNLHEWVSDTVDAALLAHFKADTSRSFQPCNVGNGVFMGGFFSTRAELGPGCTFTTVAHDPTYHDYSTGFRCCAEAPLESGTASSDP